MVTARQEPRLVLVSITYEDDCLVFQAPGVGRLALPCKLPSSNKIHDCRYSVRGLGDLRQAWLPEPPPRTLSCTVGDEAGKGSGSRSLAWARIQPVVGWE